MKPHCSFLAALLLSLVAIATAQNPVPPGAPAAAPQTEMQKWLADLDAQWQAAFKRDVADAYTAENDKLRGQYVAAMEAGLTKASGAGDLNAAIVWRNEQKRFAEANGIPAQDDAADPLPVKQLRTAWRSQLPRIETDRATRAKALLAKYDQVLAQAQTQLTKGNRIDDAILVKAKRDEVAAAWLAGIPVTPPPSVAVAQPKPPTMPPASVDSGNDAVKALVAGSRWVWFATPDLSGNPYWGEFYKDGTARTSWQTGHTWEILPPNVLHVFQPSDKRNWYFDIDVAKRTGLKNPEMDKNNDSIRFEKRVSSPPTNAKKK